MLRPEATTLESRLNYGAVIGHEPETGNILVENFINKQIEKVSQLIYIY